MLVLCLWLRELLAMVLQSPRPYWFGEGVRTFQTPPLTTPTFSLPSGHATAAAAFSFSRGGDPAAMGVGDRGGTHRGRVCLPGLSRGALGIRRGVGGDFGNDLDPVLSGGGTQSDGTLVQAVPPSAGGNGLGSGAWVGGGFRAGSGLGSGACP